jgi:hypothetical protein
MTAAVLAALSLLIVVGASHAQDYTLLAGMESGPVVGVCTTQDGQKVKCIKFNPRETPRPTATATPRPTLAKACDYFVTSQRTITFPIQAEPTVICVDPPAGASPFVEISTQNHGNASCADFWMQGYGPTGEVSFPSTGPQPGVTMHRVPGRYYVAVTLRSANNPACQTLTVYVR